jgi:hypothetical protein
MDQRHLRDDAETCRDAGKRRYLSWGKDFDTRALTLGMEIEEHWDPHVQELHLRNKDMDPTEALRRLQALVQSEPDFRAVRDDDSCPPETLKWLGELGAVVDGMKRTGDAVPLKLGIGRLLQSKGTDGADQIRAALYSALGAAELAAPASEQGAFIAAGNELDAYAAISKVLASAKADLLVVDAYMDGNP